jgi:uncharacterized protein YcfJ
MRRRLAGGLAPTAVLNMPPLARRLVPSAAALLAGCATFPSGPDILVLPGSTKSFEAFRADDAVCREFATGQIGGTTPAQAATAAGVGGAAIGAAVGAVAGAAFGGSSGAAIGAGAGLLTGTAVGAGYGYDSWWVLQRRYDNAYLQCMYAKGNKVPLSTAYSGSPQRAQVSSAPPASSPYPPPNQPPPPPSNQPPPPPPPNQPPPPAR